MQVVASETLIRDIIGKLLSNAVKFTQKGKVKLYAAVDGECVRVEISDTGVGIPQREMPRIFEKFYQVNRGKQQQQGAGLGLYIAKNLAAINNCEINISSSEGVGTKVILNIPTR